MILPGWKLLDSVGERCLPEASGLVDVFSLRLTQVIRISKVHDGETFNRRDVRRLPKFIFIFPMLCVAAFQQPILISYTYQLVGKATFAP